MRNIKLTIEYDGSNYAGWQVQPEQNTIQSEIIDALERVTGQRVNLTGAGRTDAGVHALGQVANFKIEHGLESERFAAAISYYLPRDILIISSEEAASDFDARRSALSKRYRYMIGLKPSALYRNQRWMVNDALSIDRLNQAASITIGEHDFTPFCVVSSRKENNVCRVFSAKWRKVGPLLILEIRGNRFLHNMVRILVGAMVNLAGKNPDKNKLNLTLDSYRDIILSSSEQRVVFTAPPQGLYLVAVNYSKEDQDEVLHRYR